MLLQVAAVLAGFLALVGAEPVEVKYPHSRRVIVDHAEVHPGGAETVFRADVTIPNHVLSLDDDDNVVDVQCVQDGLVIEVASVDKAVLSWPSGTVLVAGPHWAQEGSSCFDDKVGQSHAFYRRVLLSPVPVDSVSVGGVPKFRVQVSTAPAALSHCFHRSSIMFRHQPSADDKHLYQSDAQSLRRSLYKFNQRLSFTFFNYNYDESTGEPEEEWVPLDSRSLVWLKDSSIYAFAALDFAFNNDNSDAVTFSCKASIQWGLTLQPAVKMDPSRSLAWSGPIYPRDQNSYLSYGSLSFSVAGVKISVQASGRFDWEVAGSIDRQLYISPGGVTHSGEWFAGMQYANGALTPTYGKNLNFGFVKPFYEASATASITLRIHMRTKLFTSAAYGAMEWPFEFDVVPALTATATTRGCTGVAVAITSNVRVDLGVTVQPIDLVWPFSDLTLGGRLPYSKSFEVLADTKLSIASSQGCVAIGFPSWFYRRRLSAAPAVAESCPYNNVTGLWGCAYEALPWSECSSVSASSAPSVFSSCMLSLAAHAFAINRRCVAQANRCVVYTALQQQAALLCRWKHALSLGRRLPRSSSATA